MRKCDTEAHPLTLATRSLHWLAITRSHSIGQQIDRAYQMRQMIECEPDFQKLIPFLMTSAFSCACRDHLFIYLLAEKSARKRHRKPTLL